MKNPISLLKEQLDLVVGRTMACVPEEKVEEIANLLSEKAKAIRAASGEAE